MHRGSPRVFAYVRQRLLGDPEERRLYFGWQTLIAKRFFQSDLQAFRLERLDLKTDGGGQAEVVEHRGPQVVDHLPRLSNYLPDELERLIELLLAAGRLGRIVAGEDLKVLVGCSRGLGQAVVDVVGDAATLFFLGRY